MVGRVQTHTLFLFAGKYAQDEDINEMQAYTTEMNYDVTPVLRVG